MASDISKDEEQPPLDEYMKNRLNRFLHTGTENPKYYPGCWSTHGYFEDDKLPVIDEIFERYPRHIEVINIIVKAYKDGWYTRFETIAFALTKCVKIGEPEIKHAAYQAAITVCQSPEEMLLFNKYTRHLKTGNGKGWCKCMRRWYGNKQPMDLAKEVTRVRSRYGRSHKTILRKSHISIKDGNRARDAVIKYVIFGLKRAKTVYEGMSIAEEVLNYIQNVEDMRHCEDPIAAGALVAQNQFTLDHIPGHLLTSQEVWNGVLPHLSIEEVLHHTQRIHNMGFFSEGSLTTAIYISVLNNTDLISKSNVTPLQVYITICNYIKNSRPLKHEKLKFAIERERRRRMRQKLNEKTNMWEWTVNKRHPKELKYLGIDQPANEDVLTVLRKLLNQSWLLSKPTGARYMITMDMRQHMFKGRQKCKESETKKSKKERPPKPKTSEATVADEPEKKKKKKRLHAECFYNRHVTPGHAAIVIALQFLKREKNVTLAVFTDDGVQVVNIDSNTSSIESAEELFQKMENLGRVQLDAPIEWAIKNCMKYDVFINIIDRPSRYMELDKAERGGRGPGGRFGPPPKPERKIPDHCPVRALQRYRNTLIIPDARLICMSLASHRVESTDGTHEGVLDVVGIDEHVPKLLDAFVLGQFK